MLSHSIDFEPFALKLVIWIEPECFNFSNLHKSRSQITDFSLIFWIFLFKNYTDLCRFRCWLFSSKDRIKFTLYDF